MAVRTFRGSAAAFTPADPQTFTGPAHMQRLAGDEDVVPVHLYRVEFEHGGRTNWHVHTGPQWLFVIDGRIRVQRWGQPAEDLDTGDAVLISGGEKHWHGAAPGSTGSHLAMNVKVKTEWLEPVNDFQYKGQ